MAAVDSTRLVQLALGVPDAIAPDRREDAAVRRLYQLVDVPNVRSNFSLSDALQPRSAFRTAIDDATEMLDNGDLDTLILADDAVDLDKRHPLDGEWRGRVHLVSYVARAIVAYAKAHPVLDSPLPAPPTGQRRRWRPGRYDDSAP